MTEWRSAKAMTVFVAGIVAGAACMWLWFLTVAMLAGVGLPGYGR